MAKEKTENQSVATVDTSDKESTKGTMFERLFAPQSADTSVSSASDDERSLESHSNVSTLSGTSGGSDDSSCSSSRSTHRFDRELRAKHKNACKNMTVSSSATNRIVPNSIVLTSCPFLSEWKIQ